MLKNPNIKLLNFLVSLRRLPPLSALSGDEERMLFDLQVLAAEKGSLSVSDVYDLCLGKSASSSYRMLMALKNKGLVEITVDKMDRRKRHVTFTPLAERVFSVFG